MQFMSSLMPSGGKPSLFLCNGKVHPDPYFGKSSLFLCNYLFFYSHPTGSRRSRYWEVIYMEWELTRTCPPGVTLPLPLPQPLQSYLESMIALQTVMESICRGQLAYSLKGHHRSYLESMIALCTLTLTQTLTH